MRPGKTFMLLWRLSGSLSAAVLVSVLLFAAQGQSRAQNAPPPDPAPQQGTGAQATAQPAPAPAGQGPEAPSTIPHLPPGISVYIVIVEPVRTTALAEVPFRTSAVGLYEKTTKEFEKQKRFRVVESFHDADIVFFVLRFWKTGGFHTETCAALAVPAEAYNANVQWLNGFRGTAHVEAMLASAFWSSNKNYNMTKHWVVGLATSSLVDAGRPNPADLVKEFHHDLP